MMRQIQIIIVAALCLFSGAVIAQVDSTTTASPTQPTSGEVQSQIPAATTGTAPIDTGIPSGTGTTGTSGTTMEEAAEDNSDGSSLVWGALLAVALAGLIVYMRKKKRTT
jgi:LPXTG-motif cell wall-anchored protein